MRTSWDPCDCADSAFLECRQNWADEAPCFEYATRMHFQNTGISFFVRVSITFSYSTCISTLFYYLIGLSSQWFQLK